MSGDRDRERNNTGHQRRGPEDAVVATYYLETDKDLTGVARHMAWEETVGGQMDLGHMSDLLRECVGQVKSVEEFEPGKGIVKILLPLINMDWEHAPFQHLWMYVAGGPAFELTSYTKIRLLDVELPEKMLARFPGPRLGLRAFRRLVGVGDGELLLGTIVKPCCGLTEAEVADLIYEAAMAGVDLIKDDEKMNNVAYCDLAGRVRLVTSKLDLVEQRTGKRPLYCVNITTRTSKILDNARIARDNGARALMLNMFASGFDSLQILAESEEVDLPVYCHSGTRSALGRASGQGIDLVVIARLARYLGASFLRTGIVGGYCVGEIEQFKRANEALTQPVPGIKDTIVALSGGLRPGNLGPTLAEMGFDAVYMGGSSLADHPAGVAAGVRAFRQAASAFREGVPVVDYAKGNPELKAAVEKWGVFDDGGWRKPW